MIKKYNKLVRDRIPEIIESSGRICDTEILSDEDYLQMLDAKLDEELAEYGIYLADSRMPQLLAIRFGFSGMGEISTASTVQ